MTVAVHSQLEPFVETVKDPEPPAASIEAVAGSTPVTTHGSPSCVITCVKPPTEIVAIRSSVVGLRSTEYSMVPDSPWPVAP